MVIAVSQASTMATLGKGQAEFFVQHGFEVHVLAKADGTEQSVIEEGAIFHHVDFRRALSPIADIIAMFKVLRLFLRIKPEVIQLMTTKPGFVCSVVGRISGVPLIIRHKWGYVRECNYHGIKKFLLLTTDKLCNKLAHRVVVICHKLLLAEVKAKAVEPTKAVVYGSGSSNGLDLERFRKTEKTVKWGREVRDSLNIPLTAPVIGTVMRINIEKGIRELIDAFLEVSKKCQELRLIIVGDYDIRNLPSKHYMEVIANHSRIHHVGFQKNIEKYYAAMNIFVMPSYREGFCKSNIEASGMEIPVIATNIIGCSESVKNGVSGILVPPRTVQPLADAIEKFLLDKEFANKIGMQGRRRVESEFDQKKVWHSQLRDICKLLQDINIKLPVVPGNINNSSCLLCRKK
jgi:glycosyltransferase involved in cell wall biosynthesis